MDNIPREIIDEFMNLWYPLKKYISKYNGAFDISYNSEDGNYIVTVDVDKIQKP